MAQGRTPPQGRKLHSLNTGILASMAWLTAPCRSGHPFPSQSPPGSSVSKQPVGAVSGSQTSLILGGWQPVSQRPGDSCPGLWFHSGHSAISSPTLIYIFSLFKSFIVLMPVSFLCPPPFDTERIERGVGEQKQRHLCPAPLLLGHPFGEDPGLEPCSLYMGTCVLDQEWNHPASVLFN